MCSCISSWLYRASATVKKAWLLIEDVQVSLGVATWRNVAWEDLLGRADWRVDLVDAIDYSKIEIDDRVQNHLKRLLVGFSRSWHLFLKTPPLHILIITCFIYFLSGAWPS